MAKETKAILVFTGRSPERIIREGGSQAWALDPKRASECSYLICTQNSLAGDWADPTEPHGSAFIIGKIRRVVRSDENPQPNRFMIEISEYARLNLPNVWEGHRNPVRYVTLEELKIDPAKLSFEQMPLPQRHSKGNGGTTSLMEGITGWFSLKEKKIDFAPASVHSNDDSSITVEMKHPRHGHWKANLSLDPRWGSLTGDASNGEGKAIITRAHLIEVAPRVWNLIGQWIEEGEPYHWWAELLEVRPCRELLRALGTGGLFFPGGNLLENVPAETTIQTDSSADASEGS
jgi:hypothetical protein